MRPPGIGMAAPCTLRMRAVLIFFLSSTITVEGGLFSLSSINHFIGIIVFGLGIYKSHGSGEDDDCFILRTADYSSRMEAKHYESPGMK